MNAHVLVIATDRGEVAVSFPSLDAARYWEDEHETEITALGCFPIVSKAEALNNT